LKTLKVWSGSKTAFRFQLNISVSFIRFPVALASAPLSHHFGFVIPYSFKNKLTPIIPQKQIIELSFRKNFSKKFYAES
jgi:hypothetical protein